MAARAETKGKAAGKVSKSSKSRSRSTTKGKAGKKAELYALGDYIGGYVISSIEAKRIVLDYYGEKVTLYLHEGKEPTKGDVTPLEDDKPKPRAKPKTPARRAKGINDAERKKMEDELSLKYHSEGRPGKIEN